MTEPTPQPTGSAFISGAMIAIGALLVTLCGTCTLFFGGGSLWSLLTGHNDGGLGWTLLLTALVLGGLPTLGGFILVREGLKHFQRPKAPPQAFD